MRTSLVVQLLRIHLAMQETLVWSVVWEDPTGLRETKSLCRNYRANALESCKLQPLSPRAATA